MDWPWRMGAERKSAGGPLIALSQLGAAQWGGRDARSLARDGYGRNAVAHRCVRMIAEAAASVPLKGEGEALAALIARPNPDEPSAAFWERLIAQLQIAGNAFVEAVSLEPAGPPHALFALRPDRTRALADKRGWPEAWAYRGPSGERRIGRDEEGWSPVLHLKLFHPSDDIYGMSPLSAARMALDLHNASADWAKALIDNAARPSGALVYGKDGARMTDDQFDRLKTELEAAHQGARNAGRPLLLEGGLDWKPMSLSPAEMDFLEARNGAAREIALAFGVPPMLLGIPGDNTYANYKEANLAFWRLTVLPLVQKLAAALSGWLGVKFEEASIRCDLDAVPALAGEREALWARLEAASFLTDAERREMAGLPPREAAP